MTLNAHLMKQCQLMAYGNGLGAKSENLSSVAPPGKRNSIDIMCKVYGAWKTMLY